MLSRTRLLHHLLPRLRLRSLPPPLPRPLCTAAPATAPTPYSALPLSKPLQSALSDLSTFPDLHQAIQTPSPTLSQTLFHRLLDLCTHTFPQPSPHLPILHACLARLHHTQAGLQSERHHRLSVASSLAAVSPSDPSDRVLHTAHVAAAHIALGLACLRAPGPEARLSAAAAASSAQPAAQPPPLRMAAALLSALSAHPGSRAMTTVLSALVAMDQSAQPSEGPSAAPLLPGLDVPGFARLFLALHGGKRGAPVDGVDHAQALVVRWDACPHGFDLVEALCVAAGKLTAEGAEDDFAMAEDMLGKALRVAGEVGTELDKGEALLALAELYETRGRPVEAEGMFRAVEERFEPLRKRKMFTVAAAELYCRAMERYGTFLETGAFEGVTRGKEAEQKRERAAEVRQLFPEILTADERPCVPLWVVESLLPHFELPVPVFEGAK